MELDFAHHCTCSSLFSRLAIIPSDVIHLRAYCNFMVASVGTTMVVAVMDTLTFYISTCGSGIYSRCWLLEVHLNSSKPTYDNSHCKLPVT